MRSLPSCSRDVGSQPRSPSFGLASVGASRDRQESDRLRTFGWADRPRAHRASARGVGSSTRVLRRATRGLGPGGARGSPPRRVPAGPTLLSASTRCRALTVPPFAVGGPVRPLRGSVAQLRLRKPLSGGRGPRGASAPRGAGGFGRLPVGWLATWRHRARACPSPGFPGPPRRPCRGVPAVLRLRPDGGGAGALGWSSRCPRGPVRRLRRARSSSEGPLAPRMVGYGLRSASAGVGLRARHRAWSVPRPRSTVAFGLRSGRPSRGAAALRASTGARRALLRWSSGLLAGPRARGEPSWLTVSEALCLDVGLPADGSRSVAQRCRSRPVAGPSRGARVAKAPPVARGWRAVRPRAARVAPRCPAGRDGAVPVPRPLRRARADVAGPSGRAAASFGRDAEPPLQGPAVSVGRVQSPARWRMAGPSGAHSGGTGDGSHSEGEPKAMRGGPGGCTPSGRGDVREDLEGDSNATGGAVNQ